MKKFNFTKEPGIPICWAVERKYYYCGVQIAVARAADIYNKPTVSFEDVRFKTLKSIDVEKLIKINKDKLFIIENESLDFIKSVYEKYHSSYDAFASAFSGVRILKLY